MNVSCMGTTDRDRHPGVHHVLSCQSFGQSAANTMTCYLVRLINHELSITIFGLLGSCDTNHFERDQVLPVLGRRIGLAA